MTEGNTEEKKILPLSLDDEKQGTYGSQSNLEAKDSRHKFSLKSIPKRFIVAFMAWLGFGYLATRLGGKNLFGIGILVTALLTLLTPLSAMWSFYVLAIVRFIEGFFEGVTYPSMHAVWRNWAPPLEKTKLVSFAFSGAYLGTVISTSLSGWLADTFGWPSVFYVFGVIAVIWCVLWMIFIYDSPSNHPSISDEERQFLAETIIDTRTDHRHGRTPWWSIVRSMAVWAIVCAHFSENWGFYTLLTELPTFMNYILRFNLTKTGFLSALPYLVMVCTVIGAGQLADFLRRRRFLATTTARKIFTCGAFASQFVFLLCTAYSSKPAVAVTCLTFAVGFGGFAWAGFSVNHLDIAPEYAGILMGISNTFATLPGIVSPLITGAIVTDKSNANQWRAVFYIACAVYGFGCLMYGIFASGHPQSWADPHLEELDTADDEVLEEVGTDREKVGAVGGLKDD